MTSEWRCRPYTGLDVVEVQRFTTALEKNERLEARLFTPPELALLGGRPGRVRQLAARFAAKEAVGKMLGCGVTAWHEIEVVHEEGGAPGVRLHGRALARAEALGIGPVALSLTHTDTIAAACAVAVAVVVVGDVQA